jgi:hypothetical protein
MSTNCFPMASASRLRQKGVCAGVFLALTTALIGAAAAQAQATAPTGVQKCGTVTAAHWSIRGSGSGTGYTVSSNGLPCSLALKLVPGLTHQSNHGLGTGLKSPSSFKCKSWSVTASGDKLVYAGACLRGPGVPSFAWTPKK